MRCRGLRMICLMAVTGFPAVGCYRPVTMPPPARIPRRPVQPDPNLSRTIPRGTQRYSRPSRPFGEPPERPKGLDDVFKPQANERDWKYIVLHHTATSRGDVESIDRAHSRRTDADGDPWLGIGYHFVIGNGNGMPDGEIEPTFRWNDQIHGAHAGADRYNQRGIGIALVGNFEKQRPSSAQIAAVKTLIGMLKNRYGISSENVVGHNDVKATACPGQYFPLSEVASAAPGWSFGNAGGGQRNIQLVGHKETAQP